MRSAGMSHDATEAYHNNTQPMLTMANAAPVSKPNRKSVLGTSICSNSTNASSARVVMTWCRIRRRNR